MDGAPDYAKLYTEHHEAIRRYIYRHVGDPWLADELASETFEKAISAERRGVGVRSNHRSWLYQIAKNLTVDYYRARGAAKRGKSVGLDDVFVVPTEDQTASVADREVLRGVIAEAIGSVSGRHIDVVMMRLQGYSENEIAEELDMPIGTVKSKKHRGYEVMRKVLLRGLAREGVALP